MLNQNESLVILSGIEFDIPHDLDIIPFHQDLTGNTENQNHSSFSINHSRNPIISVSSSAPNNSPIKHSPRENIRKLFQTQDQSNNISLNNKTTSVPHPIQKISSSNELSRSPSQLSLNHPSGGSPGIRSAMVY